MTTKISPLEWLKNRGYIDSAQYVAGKKFAGDYHLSCAYARMGIDLRVPRSTPGPMHIADTALGARQRYRRICEFVGPRLDMLLEDVCVRELSLEEVEKLRDWPRASAKVVLVIALERIATYYGLVITAPARAAGGRQ